jgi:hypothetical protein
MTSDGIAGADWDRVHALAVDIVNCSTADDETGRARAQTALVALLNELDEKYGRKPSLLATRADYVESPEDRGRLLLAAYEEARRIGDGTNQELTAHSLAHFFIVEIRSFDQGAKWLAAWKDALGSEPDPYELGELARLEAILLRRGAG